MSRVSGVSKRSFAEDAKAIEELYSEGYISEEMKILPGIWCDLTNHKCFVGTKDEVTEQRDAFLKWKSENE